MLTFRSSFARAISSVVVAISSTAAISQAQTFSNPTLIRIPSSGTGPGPASPYPSNIVVSGLTTPIGDVTITITGLTHTFPGDIGLLLVSPSGQSVVLMANCGGACDVSGVNLRFSDGAAQLSNGCILSGNCSPTVLGPVNFDPPAPAAPYSNALSLFSGTTANGTWSLYVIDDAFLDSGSISGGWSITFSNPSLTYQGRLDNGSQPVNSNTDFIFSLFDVPTGGTAMRTVSRNNVPVANGLFNVDLGVDASLFDGTPRWVEVMARNPAGLGFFTLVGRQPLNYAPQSIYARSAGFARNASSAANAAHADQASTASVATFANNADAADFAIAAGSADTADLATAATRLDAPDGSPTGAVVVTNTGEVGIPIATVGNKFTVIGNTHLAGNVALGLNLLSAQTLLQVSGGTSGATVPPNAPLMVENFDASYINIATQNANEHGIIFGSPASSVHGGIYYKNSVGMDFRTNNDASRMTINSSGNVGIGVGVSGGSIDARLHIAGGAASNRPLKVDRTGSDGELIAFARDDSLVGNITLASGVVSYNAFTGSHWAWMETAQDRGTLVSMTGDNRTDVIGSEVIYGVAVTSRANDPACLGSYLAPADGIPRGHQIMAAGNGEMWVVNTGRDIQPGDYLISSDVAGCAMLDDTQRFAIGNIVARAAQGVRWNDVSDRKVRISVLFGSFTRSLSQETRVHDLEVQNAELLKRIERLERALTGGQ